MIYREDEIERIARVAGELPYTLEYLAIVACVRGAIFAFQRTWYNGCMFEEIAFLSQAGRAFYNIPCSWLCPCLNAKRTVSGTEKCLMK